MPTQLWQKASCSVAIRFRLAERFHGSTGCWVYHVGYGVLGAQRRRPKKHSRDGTSPSHKPRTIKLDDSVLCILSSTDFYSRCFSTRATSPSYKGLAAGQDLWATPPSQIHRSRLKPLCANTQNPRICSSVTLANKEIGFYLPLQVHCMG